MTEVLTCLGNSFRLWWQSAARIPLWVFFLYLGWIFRSRIAELPDEELSRFLVVTVLKEAIILGGAQLTFLMFDPIRCDGLWFADNNDWRECKRSLFSQLGLGSIVATFVTLRVFSGLIPRKLREKHIVKMKSLVTMRMRAGDVVQVVGMGVAGSSALFLLGNYGAEGGTTDEEQLALFLTMGVGCGVLIFTAFWKLLVILREMKQNKEDTMEQPETDSSYALEMSMFWVIISVLATIGHSMLSFAAYYTMDNFYTFMSPIAVPISSVLFAMAFFAQPRRRSRPYMW